MRLASELLADVLCGQFIFWYSLYFFFVAEIFAGAVTRGVECVRVSCSCRLHTHSIECVAALDIDTKDSLEVLSGCPGAVGHAVLAFETVCEMTNTSKVDVNAIWFVFFSFSLVDVLLVVLFVSEECLVARLVACVVVAMVTVSCGWSVCLSVGVMFADVLEDGDEIKCAGCRCCVSCLVCIIIVKERDRRIERK